MRFSVVLGMCLLGPWLVLRPTVAVAQGPSAGPRFETLAGPEVECALPECRGARAERRRSRLGHSVLVGAVIGGAVGLITAALAYEFCSNSEDSRARETCGGTVALAFGIDVAIGSAIGLIVGGSEPSHGPVPSD